MWRVLGIQASWSYQRMQGVGLAYALTPLYRHLFASDPGRLRAALARSSRFFNANPYFAPAALGAIASVEAANQPPAQVSRLHTALSGPLGALGDRLFWAGLVPAMMSLAVVLVAFGAGAWPLLGLVAAHNLFRLGLGRWLFALGWSEGFGVGKALGESWVPRVSGPLVSAGILLSALAVPVGSRHLLEGSTLMEAAAAVGLAVLMLLVRRLTSTRGTAPLLTLAAVVLVILWHWGKA